MSKLSFVATASITVLLAVSGCAMCAKNKDTNVAWAEVPAPVQKTITDNAKGKTVDMVEKETDEGKTLYEAKVPQKHGAKLVIKVNEDGTLDKVMHKSRETEVAWKNVPKAVRKTITDNANGQSVDKVEKALVDGKMQYEAKVANKDGSMLIIKVAKNGTLIMTKTKEA